MVLPQVQKSKPGPRPVHTCDWIVTMLPIPVSFPTASGFWLTYFNIIFCMNLEFKGPVQESAKDWRPDRTVTD